MAATALDTLTDLAREARDKAGMLLANERKSQQQIEQQQEVLMNYRAEYASQLQRLLVDGIDPVTLQNYRQFLMSLDDSIQQASRALQQQNQKVLHTQKNWQQQQKKLSSFTTLGERRATEVRLKESRKEQQQTDEFANQRFVRGGLSLVSSGSED